MTRPLFVSVLLVSLLAQAAGCGEKPEEPAAAADALAGDAPPTLEIDPYADAGPTRIRFDDVTAKAGISEPNHSGRPGLKEFLIEAVGPGAAWFDYDQDGFIDLYVPDGDIFPNYELAHVPDPDKEGVRRAVLVRKSKPVATYRDQLWRNNGDGTFTDVAAKVGLQGPPWRWSTCAGVGDFDGDGRVDLYVGAYSDPAAEIERLRLLRGDRMGLDLGTMSGRECSWRGIAAYCGPVGLQGQHDTLYRQTEQGVFEDVTVAWGLRPRIALYAFTCLVWDYDEDGLLDVYVANDSVENTMWHQERDAQGGVRFREVSDTLGVKYGRQITPQASMGMALGDVNGDGRLDLFITNFSHDYNNLYVARQAAGGGAVYFKDHGLQTMGQQVYYDLSWGCGLYDFDNDGDLDLFIANGHVYKEIELFKRTGATYEQFNSLFECMQPESLGFREIGAKGQRSAGPRTNPDHLYAGEGMAVERCSRQSAFGDFDNDGRMDMVVLNMNEAPSVLRNTTPAGPDAQWIKFSLAQPGGNREALGAFVEVRAGGRTRRLTNVRQSSFLGCDDPRLHVGLGSARRCAVRVVWPGAERAVTDFGELEAGAHYRLDRATGAAAKLPLPR